jgi:TfoX/Sxy family transcriptional regulator of competence genes
MGSRKEIADHIAEQIGAAGEISTKKMFGEYGVYCDGKIVAFICDDQLFIKPTQSAKDFIGDVEEAPPYPGAKNYFLIPEDKWDDEEWMSELIRISYRALPEPKPKKKRAK